MGRPSKISEEQWREVGDRYARGESVSGLAREFGVPEKSIRRKFKTCLTDVRSLAEDLAKTEMQIAELPIISQVRIRSLADELKEISMHLASAARYGAATAHRLAGIANEKTDLLDPTETIDMERLSEINALTRTANEASNIGINLIKANQEAIKQNTEKEMSSVPRRIVSKEDAARAYMDLIRE
jgi:transposase-like protein